MTKKTILFTALAILAAAIVAAAAVPGKRAALFKDLGLTKEQETKLQDLRYAHRKKTADLRHDLELKRLDVRRELERDQPDAAAIDRLLDESAAMRGRLSKERIHNILDIRKVLTPEQWEKAKSRLLERMEGARGRRMGNCDGPGAMRRHGRGGRGQDAGPHTDRPEAGDSDGGDF